MTRENALRDHNAISSMLGDYNGATKRVKVDSEGSLQTTARDTTVVDITNANDETDINVDATSTVYTKSVDITNAEYFGVFYKGNSDSGSIELTITYEQSWTEPETEGSDDDNFVEPENTPDIVTDLSTEDTWYGKAINPIPAKYLRFKIVGSGTNNADTIANLKLTLK